MPDFGWVFTLLNGLEPSTMRETNHVLHVIRQRLERYQQKKLPKRQRGIAMPR